MLKAKFFGYLDFWVYGALVWLYLYLVISNVFLSDTRHFCLISDIFCLISDHIHWSDIRHFLSDIRHFLSDIRPYSLVWYHPVEVFFTSGWTPLLQVSPTCWMLGSTPPWAIVTPASSLLSSSSFLTQWRGCQFQAVTQSMTWWRAGGAWGWSSTSCCLWQRSQPARGSLLPGIPSQLPGRLGHRLLLASRSYPSWQGWKSLIMIIQQHYLSSLWILPTGNWSPARLERDLDLVFTLPPLPRPDILSR